MATTNMFYSHECIIHRERHGGKQTTSRFPWYSTSHLYCLPLAASLLFHGLLPPKLKLVKRIRHVTIRSIEQINKAVRLKQYENKLREENEDGAQSRETCMDRIMESDRKPN